MESVKLKYRPDLDGLRGIAVVAVLGFHAFPDLVQGGFIGVDIFFVISGYLISSILLADFQAPAAQLGAVVRSFYARRVKRIFPALIVVLIASYLLGYFLLIPNELERLSGHIVASAAFCLNLVLSGQEDYFNAGQNATPLLHLWSLGIEEQFYLLWPLVIWACLRCRLKILPAAIFLAVGSFCWNAQKFVGTETAAFYLPQMRMWELLIGSITATLIPLDPTRSLGHGHPADLPAGAKRRISRPVLANLLATTGAALIAAGLVTIKTTNFRLPDQWTLLPTLGTACLIGAGRSAWINRRILAQKSLVWVGLISYPLYLWHWPLLVFTHLSSSVPDTRVVRGALLLLSLLLAWLTYALVERPLRQSRRVSRTAVVTTLTGAMVLVAAAGYYTEHAKGFPDRFPALMNEIFAFHYDPAIPLRQGTYFLSGDQDAGSFAKDAHEIVKGRPTLVLWGDSHAAALYPGLKSTLGDRFNIVQRTAGRTAPFLPGHFNAGNAQSINRYVLDLIRRVRPEYVLLEADWEGYPWTHIEATIASLKAMGIPHVVLIGPVPQWESSLPQELFNYLRLHHNAAVPTRMRFGADPEPARLDPLMAALAQRAGAEYISLCQILGGPEGYLVRTGDTADSLTTYDNSHLTVQGSEYVAAHFPPWDAGADPSPAPSVPPPASK